MLTGNYTYTDFEGDTEGTSTFTWYRSTNFDGSDKQVIVGATSQTYTLTSLDKEKYIFFEVTPIAQSGEQTGLSMISSATPIEVPAPEMLPTTRIMNGSGNVLGKVDVGDQIIIEYNKPMDVNKIGVTFNISFLHSAPTLIRINSTKVGRFAEIRTNAGTYTTGASLSTMQFSGSPGVWSNDNKTLTITLSNQSGEATQVGGTINVGTLTLYNNTSAIAADGTASLANSITTTDTSSF